LTRIAEASRKAVKLCGVEKNYFSLITSYLFKNRYRLEFVLFLKQQGFISLITEWWHFDAPGWDQYGLLDIPLENIR